MPAMIHQDLLSSWVCFHPVRRFGCGAIFSRYNTTLTKLADTISNLSFQEICTDHPEPHIIQTNMAAFWHLPTKCNGILSHAFRYKNHLSQLQMGEWQRGNYPILSVGSSHVLGRVCINTVPSSTPPCQVYPWHSQAPLITTSRQISVAWLRGSTRTPRDNEMGSRIKFQQIFCLLRSSMFRECSEGGDYNQQQYEYSYHLGVWIGNSIYCRLLTRYYK
jgi:hypothetical protein